MSAKKSTNTAEETALEQWAASDEPTVRDDATVTGPTEEARDAMHQMLMGAASPEQKEDIERAAKGGRPRLSPGEGRSPMWRVRVPQPLDEDLHAAAEAEGRNFSEVLRDAAEEYLDHHHRTPARTKLGALRVTIGVARKAVFNRQSKVRRFVVAPRAGRALDIHDLNHYFDHVLGGETNQKGKVVNRARTQDEATYSAVEISARTEDRSGSNLKGLTTDA